MYLSPTHCYHDVITVGNFLFKAVGTDRNKITTLFPYENDKLGCCTFGCDYRKLL